MKRLNKSCATALLRGAVVLSGFVATGVIALFTESFKSLLLVCLIGVLVIVLIDEHIKSINS